MSENTKLDPGTLSAEERAIVQSCALNYWNNEYQPDEAWRLALDQQRPFILARRSLFAPATEKAVCPNCKEETGENHVSSYNRDSFTCQPATEKVQESAFPVGNCKVCGELVAPYNKHAKYEGGYTCQPAQPEPAAPEMPLPLQIAMDALAGAASFARLEAQSDANYVVARKTLESWWRTHSQPVADEHYRKNVAERIGMNLDDFNGVPGLCDIETFVFEHDCKARQQAAQPAAVGMTEELELVLSVAEGSCKKYEDAGYKHGPKSWRAAIAAVRQQAALGKPKVELPKVPVDALKRACATCSLDDCMTIAGWLDAVEGRK